jgi:ubiquinone/menaquinone biosynthesis C-methylase UbiE
MDDFNQLSSFYDVLKRIVFGNSLDIATTHFLKIVPSHTKILIIGGGTGKILNSFNSTHHIKYVELSNSMIEKARKVNSMAFIEFIQADILKWKAEEKFDFIITPFILDCFNEADLKLIFPKLKAYLISEGCWIQTDFYPKNLTQKLLVCMMYFFFRITAKLKVKKIGDFNHFFEAHNFICIRNARFFHSMVESKIYQKID